MSNYDHSNKCKEIKFDFQALRNSYHYQQTNHTVSLVYQIKFASPAKSCQLPQQVPEPHMANPVIHYAP